MKSHLCLIHTLWSLIRNKKYYKSQDGIKFKLWATYHPNTRNITPQTKLKMNKLYIHTNQNKQQGI